jgi:hypothetical protein
MRIDRVRGGVRVVVVCASCGRRVWSDEAYADLDAPAFTYYCEMCVCLGLRGGDGR